jgi:hypothetical protein
MNYPFEFNELLLTDKILDILGFTEYQDKNGDDGIRTLFLGENIFTIWDIGELHDDSYGYGKGIYVSHHFCTLTDIKPIYFLHELWDYINEKTSQIALFEQICRKNNMGYYIDSYLEWKNKNIACSSV